MRVDCPDGLHESWKQDRATFDAHTDPLPDKGDGLVWANCRTCHSTLLILGDEPQEQAA